MVYWGDQDTDDVIELYASDLDGETNVKVSGALTVGGNLEAFEVSPGGRRVVYAADQDTDDVIELYVSHLDGTGNLKLNAALPGGLDVEAFAVRLLPE